MTEPIAKEILDGEHRLLLRQLASLIMSAMAQTDTDFPTLDARLTQTRGRSKRRLVSYIEAKQEWRVVSDLCCAMGLRLVRMRDTSGLAKHFREASSAGVKQMRRKKPVVPPPQVARLETPDEYAERLRRDAQPQGKKI